MLQHRWLSQHNKRSTMWCKFGMRQLWNYADFIFLFFVTRRQPFVWRAGHMVQTQQGVWVFHGIQCCHGYHKTFHQPLKSIIGTLIYLYVFQTTAARPDCPQPRVPRFLAHQRGRNATQIQLNTHIPYYLAVCKLQIHAFIHDRSIAQTKRMSEKTWRFGSGLLLSCGFLWHKNIKCQVNSRKLN